jgi:hypothetical protein
VEELESRHLPSAATLAVASGIVHSTENYQDFLAQEYQNLLGRAPDAAGLQNWLGQLQKGVPAEVVEAGIAGSGEYVANHSNDPTAFVTGLYTDLLGRDPDAAGFNYWTNRLAAGTNPYTVALGFSTSAERQANVIAQDYADFLGRDPEPGAVDYWLALEQQGADRAAVATRIVASDEYFAASGNDPSTFVASAYQDVLGRGPDDLETAYWLGIYDANA